MVLEQCPDATGATLPSGGSGACYCEFGMTGVNSATNWQSCSLMFPYLPCLPDPTPRPCTQAWEEAEMTEGELPGQLPILPDPTFTETNPGCNEYPECSVCSGADGMYETREAAAQQLAGYHEWVEPPASFALATATRHYNDEAEDYAHRHFGASVDGCSSDNSNSNANRGDQSGQAIPLVAHIVDDTAAVRCCSMDGSRCISQVHGVCYDTATFHEAISICRSAGMRLCSEAEMGTGVCCGTGCWFNHYASWISDYLAESALAEQQAPTYGNINYDGQLDAHLQGQWHD